MHTHTNAHTHTVKPNPFINIVTNAQYAISAYAILYVYMNVLITVKIYKLLSYSYHICSYKYKLKYKTYLHNSCFPSNPLYIVLLQIVRFYVVPVYYLSVIRKGKMAVKRMYLY